MVALVYKSIAPQEITPMVETTVTFDAVLSDVYGLLDGGVKLRVPQDGWYAITAQTCWEADSYGVRDVYVRKNGSQRIYANRISDSKAIGIYVPIHTIFYLHNGEYLELRVWQSSQRILNLYNGLANTQFGIALL